MNRTSWNGHRFALAAPALACALFSQSAQAENQERGRALYENQCESCHEGWAHSRSNRKAKSLAELRSRTAGWSEHSGLDWSSEEIDDVVEYLNDQFYHFK